MAETKNKIFETLNQIDVSDKIEKKNGFNYFSWAYAWGELKKHYPDANYKVYENAQGWNYHTDGRTAWVKVGVTIDGLEHVEMLPVMDNKNNAVPFDAVDSCMVNKSIQRALTKAIARHGLGLFVYAGEDFPEDAPQTQNKPTTVAKTGTSKPKAQPVQKPVSILCADCVNPISDYQGQAAIKIARATKAKYGVPICYDCSQKRRAAMQMQDQTMAELTPPPAEKDEGTLPFEIE